MKLAEIIEKREINHYRIQKPYFIAEAGVKD